MSRMEYWVGKAAAAGSGDWGVAKEAFGMAKLLDNCGDGGVEVENVADGSERHHRRGSCNATQPKFPPNNNNTGLNLTERALLPVLIEEVTRRHHIWTTEVENRRKEVRQRVRALSVSGGDNGETDEDLARSLEEELGWKRVERVMGVKAWDEWLLRVEVGVLVEHGER